MWIVLFINFFVFYTHYKSFPENRGVRNVGFWFRKAGLEEPRARVPESGLEGSTSATESDLTVPLFNPLSQSL